MNKLFLLLFSLSFISCDNIKHGRLDNRSPLDVDDSMYALLISKGDDVVLQEYYNGKTEEDLCNIQSLTKGLVSILIGIAIDKGHIKDEHETIEQFFPEELKEIEDVRKKEITIKHLLNQTAGLAWKGYLEHEAWRSSVDPILFVLEKQLTNTPGEIYNYNSGATHLLSVILTRATGMTTLEFAEKHLFSHLEIARVNWQRRNKGYYDGSGLGLEMRPIDLMKIGQLLLNEGVHSDVQIVSAHWLQKSFDIGLKSSTRWGLRKSKHGYCWYQTVFNGDLINYGMGYGGQFIIMVPEKDLLIVTAHDHDTPDGLDQQIAFLKNRLAPLISQYGGKSTKE